MSAVTLKASTFDEAYLPSLPRREDANTVMSKAIIGPEAIMRDEVLQAEVGPLSQNNIGTIEKSRSPKATSIVRAFINIAKPFMLVILA